MNRRTIAIVLMLAVLSGIATSIGAIAEEYPPFVHNRIVVEAEDCNIENGVLQIENRSDASNGQVLVCPRGNNITDASNIEYPALSYEFYASEEGKYSIWIKAQTFSVSGDSIWYAFDDGDYIQQTFGINKEGYEWYFVVSKKLSVGVHTIHFFPRESATVLDKLLITDQSPIIPLGSGEYGDSEETLLFPLPSIQPTLTHPRLWFAKEDIPQILENSKHEEHQAAWQTHEKNILKNVTGILDTPSSETNYSYSELTVIKSYAFDYAIRGNTELGEKAITAMINYLDTIKMPLTGYYVQAGEVIYAAAIVYDWCYDLLSAEEMDEILSGALSMAAMHTEVKWPPILQHGWGGHGSENQILRDLFSLGIAVYNENPYIYNTVAGRLEQEYKSQRQLYYKSGKLPYGSFYYYYRFNGDVSVFRIMAGMTGENFWGSDEIEQVPFWYLYAKRPDGYLLAEGDNGTYNLIAPNKLSVNHSADFAYSILGSYFKNGYLKQGFLEEKPDMNPSHPLEYLICNDPDVEPASKEDLPLSKYFDYPFSSYIARTGWDMGKNSPDVLVSMNVKNVTLIDHDHLDAGGFEIYYKGNLATDTGYYQAVRTGEESSMYNSLHWTAYHHQTIAHNCMLIYDPNEPASNFQHFAVTSMNAGGQMATDQGYKNSLPLTAEGFEENEIFNTAVTLGHEAGPDAYEPNYTYLKGDLTKSYSDKVSDYERSFMFLNLKNDETPAALIVFDRVVSSNPSFQKTYLLHGINAPEIDGTRTTLKRTENGYNGKLINDTLLPKADDVEIKQVGEHPNEYWIYDTLTKTSPAVGSMAEGGGIRTEISPKTAKNKDYFLNVMQVADGDSTHEPLSATLLESDTHTGVQIADRVVLFGNEKLRTAENISFEFEGERQYEITVSDLKEGTWMVEKDGAFLTEAIVTVDGGVALFHGGKGQYTLSYSTENAIREEISNERELKEVEIKVLCNDYFVYSEEAPILENNRVLVPMRVIFDTLGAEVSWDKSTKTATAKRYGRTVQVTADSSTASIAGKETPIDVPARIINGRIYVPIRFIAEAFMSRVVWNNSSKTVIISGTVQPPTPGYITVLNVEWDGGVVVADANGFNTIDNVTTTAWATGAAEEGMKWIAYEFTESQEFKQIEILWGNPHLRTFTYDVLASEDGENWETLISQGESILAAEADAQKYQTIQLPRGTKSKFIRLNCYGNSVTYANNIVEIKFK